MTRSRGSLTRNLLFLTMPASIVLFAGAYIFFGSVLVATTVSGVFLIASLVSNLRFFRKVKSRERLKQDPAAVEVIEVEASRIFDIAPPGDHGPAMCFFVDQRRALLLIGQWLLDQPSFPSNSFRLHYWSNTKEPILIEALAGEIVPENSSAQLRGSYDIKDISLFDATPETLQNDLDRAFAQRDA